MAHSVFGPDLRTFLAVLRRAHRPGPDRVPLLALLRATPPIEDDVTGLEHTNRVAAKLAAAGWPLAGVDTESL